MVVSADRSFTKQVKEVGDNISLGFKPVSIGRKLVSAYNSFSAKVLDIKSLNLPGVVSVAASCTKVLAFVDIFFKAIGLYETGCKMEKAIKTQDEEAIAVSVLKVGSGIAGLADKVITAAEGVYALARGVQSYAPSAAAALGIAKIPPGVTQAISILGEISTPLNIFLSTAGIVTGSIDMHRILQANKQIKAIQEELNRETVQLGTIARLLDEAVGLGAQEQKDLQDQVNRMADSHLQKHRTLLSFEQIERELEKLKQRKIEVKQARFASGTSEKVLKQMTALQKTIAEKKPVDEAKAKEVFKDIKTLMHRRIVVKSLNLVDDIVGLVVCALFYTPLMPFIPLLGVAANQIFSLSLTVYERFGMERGLKQLDAHPDFVRKA